MSISESCKAYERFHSTHYQDEPFPMSKSKLIRYIKFRARSSTCHDFLTNLDKHPRHGPAWLQEMNNDQDVRKLMDLTITLWPRQAKNCKLPLIGVGNVYETPSFERKYGKYIRDKVNQEVMYRERVHVVEGKKSRGNHHTHNGRLYANADIFNQGFMVTDISQTRLEDTGTSSESPINLDHPTPSISPMPRSKSTTPSSSSSTASKHTPSSKHAATSTANSTSRTTTTTTTTLKSTTKYDPKIDEIALREELLQQMMMPNQMRLVSQFKPSTTTIITTTTATKAPSKSSPSAVRSTSPYTPPPPSSSSSFKATIRKEKQKSASLAETPVRSASSSKPKLAATRREPVIQKKSSVTCPTINKKQSEKELWKLAQKVSVRIEQPQEDEEDDINPHQPVIVIDKLKPLYRSTSDDIEPARERASPQPEIRHPVVLIRKPRSRRKNLIVKIAKKNATSYAQQQKDQDEDGNEYQDIEENEEEQDQEERIKDEQQDKARNKRQKRNNYLYDQNRLQIVQIVIKNHT